MSLEKEVSFYLLEKVLPLVLPDFDYPFVL